MPFWSYRILLFKFGTFCFRATLRGLRNNVWCPSWAHWKACSGFPISVNWTFFARLYGWGATNENRSKFGDFAPTRSRWRKISGRRGRPPPTNFQIQPRSQPMIYCWCGAATRAGRFDIFFQPAFRREQFCSPCLSFWWTNYIKLW